MSDGTAYNTSADINGLNFLPLEKRVEVLLCMLKEKDDDVAYYKKRLQEEIDRGLVVDRKTAQMNKELAQKEAEIAQKEEVIAQKEAENALLKSMLPVKGSGAPEKTLGDVITNPAHVETYRDIIVEIIGNKKRKDAFSVIIAAKSLDWFSDYPSYNVVKKEFGNVFGKTSYDDYKKQYDAEKSYAKNMQKTFSQTKIDALKTEMLTKLSSMLEKT